MPVYSKFRPIFVGIVSGAMLIIVPSFMVLRGVQVLSVQEVVLWVVQLSACVIASIYLSGKRQQIPLFAFAYGFLLLYNALAILCAKLNYGIIAWTELSYVGLALVIGAAGFFYLLVPKMNNEQTRVVCLSCATASLTGMSFVFCTWVPLLAIPGAIVLADIYTLELFRDLCSDRPG